MSFLKKLGGIIATVIGVFNGFAPVIQKQFPQTGGVLETVSKDMTEIANIVANVEAFGQLQNLSGPDKAKVAGPLVAQVLLNSALLANKKIANPAAFNAACVTIAGGVADLLNSLHEDSVQNVTQKIDH